MRFNEILLKYGLHDTEINKIEYSDSKLILTFDSGIYILDCNGKETKKSDKCKIILDVDDLNIDRIHEHVEVTRIYKNKCVEWEYNNFIEAVSTNTLQIYLDYYCDFTKSVLIKGYILKYKIEFAITEIKDIIVLL